MTELEVQKIENRIVSKKLKELTGVPRVIRRQLLRMKEDVIRIWEIDTIYSADIQLLMFRTVAHSSLTLDVLEAIIKRADGTVKWERFLKRAVRNAKKYQKQANNEGDLKEKLKKIISGKAE